MQEMQDNVTEPVLKDAEAEPETIAPELEPEVKAKPWRKLVIIGGAVLAVLAIAVGLFVSVQNKPAEKVTVVGTIALVQELADSKYGTDNYGVSGGICAGAGGYDDLRSGASVTVYGAAHQIIGVGNLGVGTELSGMCYWGTEVTVPAGEAFYSMEVTHRGELTASADEIADGRLLISGSIG